MLEIIDFLINEALLSSIILVATIMLIISIVADKFRKYYIVDTDDAVSLIDEKGSIVIDIRHEKERSNGHIAGDIHIPVDKIKTQLSKLDKNKKVLIYCHNDSKSKHTAKLLTHNEFKQVYVLKNGIKAWEKANLPITK